MSGVIGVKRVYEPAMPGDGRRVLVDHIWPRGLTKARVAADLWLKEAAPSAATRKWFGHRPDRWPEFRRRYLAELAGNPAVAQLRELAAGEDVTLVYAARDEARNNAVVLAEHLAATK